MKFFCMWEQLHTLMMKMAEPGWRQSYLTLTLVKTDLEIGDGLSDAILGHTEMLEWPIILYHKDRLLQSAVLQTELQHKGSILILITRALYPSTTRWLPQWPLLWDADLLIRESTVCTAVNEVVHPLPLHDVVQYQLPSPGLLTNSC